MFDTIVCFLRLLAVALLVMALTACQTSSTQTPTSSGAPVGAPPITAMGPSATPALDVAPEQAVKAALQAQYPGAAIRLQCVQGGFAAAAVAPLSGQHGFDAYLHQQNDVWTILTNGVDVSRESLLAFG